MAERGPDTTARLGVSALETFFSKHDWLLREQYLHDWGIDAQVEPKENGKPTGQLIALQIKTGRSWFRSENEHGVRHAISDEHRSYWLRYQLPVYIFLHDPDEPTTIWQKVEPRLLKQSKKGGYYIRIPRTNILSSKSLRIFREGLAGDPTSFRRNNLALDYALMCAVKDADASFLRVTEMYQKGLNMRGGEFRFGDEDKQDPDFRFALWQPHSDIHEYMAWAFPWLAYEHTEALQDSLGAIEGEVHRLAVQLNAVGSAFLRLEEFYAEGATPKSYPVPYDDADEPDEEEQADLDYRRAVDRD